MVLSRRTCVITDGRALFSLWPLYVCHISFIGYMPRDISESVNIAVKISVLRISLQHTNLYVEGSDGLLVMCRNTTMAVPLLIFRGNPILFMVATLIYILNKNVVFAFSWFFSDAHHVAFLVIITILADVRWDLYSVSFAFVWSLVLLNIFNIFCRFHIFFWKYCSFACSQTGLLGLFPLECFSSLQILETNYLSDGCLQIHSPFLVVCLGTVGCLICCSEGYY